MLPSACSYSSFNASQGSAAGNFVVVSAGSRSVDDAKVDRRMETGGSGAGTVFGLHSVSVGRILHSRLRVKMSETSCTLGR
jgi:hypothetical protein